MGRVVKKKRDIFRVFRKKGNMHGGCVLLAARRRKGIRRAPGLRGGFCPYRRRKAKRAKKDIRPVGERMGALAVPREEDPVAFAEEAIGLFMRMAFMIIY